jgi:hypothetical protein
MGEKRRIMRRRGRMKESKLMRSSGRILRDEMLKRRRRIVRRRGKMKRSKILELLEGGLMKNRVRIIRSEAMRRI